ncbi:Cystinosin, partial [Operophtera brumata]
GQYNTTLTVTPVIQHPDIVQLVPATVEIPGSNDTNPSVQSKFEICAYGKSPGHSEVTFNVTPSGFVKKSVVGLNFDFLALNIMGFTLYSLFNCGLFFSKAIQTEYFERHPRGHNPVLLNDVFFSLHAAFATLVTITQCFLYEFERHPRGHNPVLLNDVFFSLHAAFATLVTITQCFLYEFERHPRGHNPVLLNDVFNSLHAAFATLVTITQCFLYEVTWWSIGNIFLDFVGGFLSVLQMMLNAYNYDDWASFFGDFTKFGLGAFSLIFDIFFILQHYVFY